MAGRPGRSWPRGHACTSWRAAGIPASCAHSTRVLVPKPVSCLHAPLQRLLGEVFVWGVDDFRQYCLDEPDWQAAVELLSQDDGAGWRLLQQLVGGSSSAAELAESRFCQL